MSVLELRSTSQRDAVLRRPLLAIVGALAVAAPASNHLYVPALALLGLGVLLLAGIFSGRVRGADRTEKFVLLFAGYAVLSCLWTPGYAVSSWVNVVVEYAGLAATFVLVNRLSVSAAGWRWIGYCYVGGCILIALVVFSNWSSGTSYEGAGRFSIAGVNANFTAYSMATALPIGTALLVSGPRRRPGFVAAAMVALWLYLAAAVALTGCRGAVLAVLAGAAVGIVSVVRSRPIIGTALMVVAAAIAVGSADSILDAIPPRLLLQDALDQQEWSSGRLVIWDRALDVYRDHPVFGVGADAFPSLNPDGVHAHNVVLTVLTELGAVGILLLGAALAPLFTRSFAGTARWGKASAVMSLLTWLAIALTGVWQFAVPAWLSIAWMSKIALHLPASRSHRGALAPSSSALDATAGART
jgi:O-antigen ligase